MVISNNGSCVHGALIPYGVVNWLTKHKWITIFTLQFYTYLLLLYYIYIYIYNYFTPTALRSETKRETELELRLVYQPNYDSKENKLL